MAFERGTACSETLAIMDLDKQHIEDNDSQVLKTFKENYNFTKRPETKKIHSLFVKNKLNQNTSSLSKRELEVLDLIIKTFGQKSYNELSEYTHSFKEWQKFKKNYPDVTNKCCELDIKDIFEDKTFLEHEVLKNELDEETIQVSAGIYNGEY